MEPPNAQHVTPPSAPQGNVLPHPTRALPALRRASMVMIALATIPRQPYGGTKRVLSESLGRWLRLLAEAGVTMPQADERGDLAQLSGDQVAALIDSASDVLGQLSPPQLEGLAEQHAQAVLAWAQRAGAQGWSRVRETIDAVQEAMRQRVQQLAAATSEAERRLVAFLRLGIESLEQAKRELLGVLEAGAQGFGQGFGGMGILLVALFLLWTFGAPRRRRR